MKARTTRVIRGWLRDMALGAFIFLMMPVAALLIAGPEPRWTLSEALAGDGSRSQSGDLAVPAVPLNEHSFAAPAQSHVVGDPVFAKQLSDWVVLGLTFSLLVAFNLAFLRHLRRISASPRRD